MDYCGFPVLPIAIQQDVVIAGRADPSDRVLTVSSSNDSFQEYSCNIRDVQVGFNRPSYCQSVFCLLSSISFSSVFFTDSSLFVKCTIE